MDLAVIGCGPWGQNVIRTLLELEESEAVRLNEVVHTGNSERARTINEDFNFDPHTNIQEAINRNPAVCIVTSDETHFELTKMALRNTTDVFVEKPLALRLGEARKLYELAEENSSLLMPGHLMLFHPVLEELQTDSEFHPDTLDEVLITRMVNLKESGERRLLHSSLIHDISLLDALFADEPDSIKVHEALDPYPPSRHLSATLEYSSIFVRVRARTDWPFTRRTTVFRIGDRYFHFDGLKEKLTVTGPSTGEVHERTTLFERLPLTGELRNFVRTMNGQETCRVTREHALRVMKTLDRCEESMQDVLESDR